MQPATPSPHPGVAYTLNGRTVIAMVPRHLHGARLRAPADLHGALAVDYTADEWREFVAAGRVERGS